MIHLRRYFWLFLAASFFVACEDDDNDPVVGPPAVELTAGQADFSNYVALGNSLTAGFMDNALFIGGQQSSFPNIMAQTFAQVGGGAFTQPLMSDNVGGFASALPGGIDPNFPPRLYFDGAGISVLGTDAATFGIVPSTDITMNVGPVNNMGVPGAKSFHLGFPGYGTLNPYFGRMASSPGATIIGDAVAQNPTFFSLWIGNNDVLSYATSGGTGMVQEGNLDPSTYGGTDITDTNVFASTYSNLVAALTANGAQGVVANIPDVTSAPFFTTVPHNPLDPSNPSFGPLIPTLNGVFSQINLIFAALGEADRSIVFSTDAASAVVIRDEDLTDLSAQIAGALNASPDFPAFVQSFGLPAQAAPLVANLLGTTYGQARQATENDLLVLTTRSLIGTVNEDVAAALEMQGLPPAVAAQFSAEGVSLPLADQWVLTPEEQANIATATAAFNATIQSVATSNGLAFVDANALLNQVATQGVPYGDFVLSGELIFGGSFSLDGVHPTPRGHSLVAAAFLLAIDETYGSNFGEAGALPDPGNFNVFFPPNLIN